MRQMREAFKWILGVAYILLGFALFSLPLAAAIIILIGVFTLPITTKILEKKMNHEFSTKTKWSIIVIGFVITVFSISKDASNINNKKGETLISKASLMIDEGNLDSAVILIIEAKNLFDSNNNAALDLEKEIDRSKDLEYTKLILSEMTEEEYNLLNHGDLNKIYLSQETLNSNFIKSLENHAHERKKYIKELKIKKTEKKVVSNTLEERSSDENWYSGGTLHSASIEQWKNATEDNKLATCADFVARLKEIKGDTYTNLDQMKRDATEMKDCINEAVKGDESIYTSISEISAVCYVLLGN